MTTKLKLLSICYWINILTLTLYFLIVIMALFRQQAFLDYVFFNKTFLNIRMILAIPILILWSYDMIIWSKRDKNVGYFLLIFFLIGLYTPFYFRKIVKNKWYIIA
jgi:hypothetical protein